MNSKKQTKKSIYFLACNSPIIYVIFISGFIISVSFGCLYHLWQKTWQQLFVNQKLQSELKHAMDVQNRTLKAAKIGTWTLNVQSNLLTGDKHVCELFGIRSKKYKGTYDEFLQFIDSKHHEYLQFCLDVSIKMGKTFEAEFPVKLPDGTINHILTKGQILYDRAENPYQLEGIAWDITDIKNAQLYLEISERAAKLFAELKPVDETSNRFLQIINEIFGWELMVFWFLDRENDVLINTHIATVSGIASQELKKFKDIEKKHHDNSFVGKVWSTLRPHWNLESNRQDFSFHESRLKGRLAIPIFEGTHLLGVMELWKTSPLTQQVDENLLDLLISIGIGYGQYLQRKSYEDKQAEFAAIVTYAHEGMYSTTLEGVVKSWNKGAQDLWVDD